MTQGSQCIESLSRAKVGLSVLDRHQICIRHRAPEILLPVANSDVIPLTLQQPDKPMDTGDRAVVLIDDGAG